MQIGNLVLERVTRRLPLLLLRDVCDRRALLLKLQLLREFASSEDGSAMTQRKGFLDKLKDVFKD